MNLNDIDTRFESVLRNPLSFQGRGLFIHAVGILTTTAKSLVAHPAANTLNVRSFYDSRFAASTDFAIAINGSRSAIRAADEVALPDG